MKHVVNVANSHGEAEHKADAFGKIEVHGINIIPDADRHGTSKELFWPWFSANSTFINMIVGGVLILLGLNIWQGLSVIIVGNLAFIIVGICSLPGPRAGTATLTISRAPFGLRGNIVPTIFSWVATLGWETINIILGTLALRTLLDELGVHTPKWILAPFLVLMAFLTFVIPILGHATLVIAQKWLAYVLVGLTIVMGILLVPKVKWGFTPGHLAASNTVSTWFLGLTAVLGAGAISWVNYASDYSRYLDRRTDGRSIVGWVMLGTALPGILFGGLGVVLGTLVDTSDPIKNLPSILPRWFLFPFLIVMIAGVIANNVMNSYSSGLSLLALGVRIERYKSVFVDAIITVTLACVALFIYDFSTVFTQFLSILVILLAPWAGVFVVDYFLRKGKYIGEDLLLTRGGSYWYTGGVNWSAMISLIIGVAAGGLTANTSKFQGYIAMHYLGGADISPFVGLILGAGIYYALASSKLRKSQADIKE